MEGAARVVIVGFRIRQIVGISVVDGNERCHRDSSVRGIGHRTALNLALRGLSLDAPSRDVFIPVERGEWESAALENASSRIEVDRSQGMENGWLLRSPLPGLAANHRRPTCRHMGGRVYRLMQTGRERQRRGDPG